MRGAICIRAVTQDDETFILGLAPRFVTFDLPAGRHKRAILAATRAQLARALREPAPDEYCFVSETVGHERSGFLRLQLQRDFFSGARGCHISDLAVAQAREGEGYGRALLDFARQWARSHHCKQLSLSVFPGNVRARSLYTHAGFHTDLLRLLQPLDPARPQARGNRAPRPRAPSKTQRKPLK